MAYIDLNMCRAGVVDHPNQWECCGYATIQNPPLRYQIIDHERTAELLGYHKVDELTAGQREWVASWQQSRSGRDPGWSGSLAIGSKAFVSDVQVRLGGRALQRQVEEHGGQFVLRQTGLAYEIDSDHETESLSSGNMVPWRVTAE
jgi:putative transposase